MAKLLVPGVGLAPVTEFQVLITLFVLFEKTMPWGGRMSRLTGSLLAVWGAVSLVRMM